MQILQWIFAILTADVWAQTNIQGGLPSLDQIPPGVLQGQMRLFITHYSKGIDYEI